MPGTAIDADPTRQVGATVPVLFYFDEVRECEDCRGLFLFFAEEQKHWYEALGFKIDADAVRCFPCRHRVREHTRPRQQLTKRYEQLVHLPERTTTETVELAECCLAMIDAGIMLPRHLERVRALLKAVPPEQRGSEQFQSLAERTYLKSP